MWQQGSVLWCCCLALCLAASASGRGLLITDQQAQNALDTVTAAAGDILGQASQALDSSSLADGTMNPWQRNHTIEAINHRAPQFVTDWGYVIRPQVRPRLPMAGGTVMHNPVGVCAWPLSSWLCMLHKHNPDNKHTGLYAAQEHLQRIPSRSRAFNAAA